MAKGFFRELVAELDDEDISLADDGLSAGEFTEFIDTGSYTFNAAVSGTLFGGIPNNKALGLAGDSATGKTFFTMGIAKRFQEMYEDGGVLYYDTEAAVNKKMMQERGLDTSRVLIGQMVTLQEFKHKAIKFLDAYIAAEAKNKPPMLMVLDSLGLLSTSKEVADTTAGEDTKDMTRATLVRAAFRVLRLKLAKARVPMIVTNHTYDTMDKYNPKAIGGGGGFKYALDTILMLSKRKETIGEKENREVIGNVVHVNVYKSRLSRENKKVDVLLTYDAGLDRYYGLLELAEKYGVLKKAAKYEFPDGSKWYGKEIYANPTKFFTKDLLEKIDVGVKAEFQYGKPVDTTSEELNGKEDD